MSLIHDRLRDVANHRPDIGFTRGSGAALPALLIAAELAAPDAKQAGLMVEAGAAALFITYPLGLDLKEQQAHLNTLEKFFADFSETANRVPVVLSLRGDSSVDTSSILKLLGDFNGPLDALVVSAGVPAAYLSRRECTLPRVIELAASHEDRHTLGVNALDLEAVVLSAVPEAAGRVGLSMEELLRLRTLMHVLSSPVLIRLPWVPLPDDLAVLVQAGAHGLLLPASVVGSDPAAGARQVALVHAALEGIHRDADLNAGIMSGAFATT